MDFTLKQAQPEKISKISPIGHNICSPGVSYIVEGKTLSSARPAARPLE